jgi:Ca-activated chloride channel family protein
MKPPLTPTRILTCLALLLILPCCRLGCSTQAAFSAQPELLRAGLESRYVLANSDGSAVLGMLIQAPPQSDAARRTPVSLALVVDTSGSMAGHKIEHARSAARAVIESLGEGDEVSLVEFETEAQLRVPLTNVNKTSKKVLLDAVEGLVDRGGTALYAGVDAGLRSLAPARNRVRRLLLLSDGHANVGPSSARDIVAGLPRLATPITISTLGIGTDYDESVLWAISEHGAGGFYHLTDPVQLKQILATELKRARTVVGRDAVLEIRSEPGVSIMASAELSLTRTADGTLRIPVGDLYAGQVQSLALPVRVPVSGAGERLLGRVRLSYRPSDPAQLVGQPVEPPIVQQLEVRYSLTASTEQLQRGERPEIMVAADRMRVAHVLTDAAALLKEGDLLEAQAVLRDERARLDQRRAHLTGAQRREAEALIAMLRDPFVDTGRPAQTAAAGQGAQGVTTPATALPLVTLIERAQQGQSLTEPELAGLSTEQLRILRNVPYARHGYPFKSPELSSYFGRLAWYHVDPRFDNARLTTVDENNVALVRSCEGGAALNKALMPVAAASGPGFDALFARGLAGGALSSEELMGLDLVKLRLLRNLSYARHGYTFRAADLLATFAKKPWYRPDPGYTESRLTREDRANIQSIKERERTLLAKAGDEALRDFQLRSRAAAYRALHP